MLFRLDVCENGSPFEHGARQVGVPSLGLVPRSSIHAIIRHILIKISYQIQLRTFT